MKYIVYNSTHKLWREIEADPSDLQRYWPFHDDDQVFFHDLDKRYLAAILHATTGVLATAVCFNHRFTSGYQPIDRLSYELFVQFYNNEWSFSYATAHCLSLADGLNSFTEHVKNPVASDLFKQQSEAFLIKLNTTRPKFKMIEDAYQRFDNIRKYRL